MNSKSQRFVKWMFIFIITAGCLTGCGSIFSYKGSRITQESLMIRLQDGNQQGVWRKNEVEITYRYQNASQTLKVSGTAGLIGGNKYFSHLAVYLLYLDEQGTVIQDTLVYSGENSRRIVAPYMDFEKSIPIPQGALAISFAYDLTPVLSNGK